MKVKKGLVERMVLFIKKIGKYENWSFDMEDKAKWIGDGDVIAEAAYLLSELEDKHSNKLIDIL